MEKTERPENAEKVAAGPSPRVETQRLVSSPPYLLRPIGWVRSTLKRPGEAPKQGFEGAPDARLEIEPAFVRGLDGIRPGQEIILLTWLHEAQREVLAVHPRDDLTRPLTGVFATRSADRPNPIGLHRVRVLSLGKDSLHVRGLEAIDGTPVLDLKPVLPADGGGR